MGGPCYSTNLGMPVTTTPPILCISPGLLGHAGQHISMRKAERFIAAVSKLGAVDVRAVPSADIEDLALAHRQTWAQDVVRGHAPDGYGLTDGVAPRFALAAVAAMAAAAKAALTERRIVCAPVHGFHHAGYDHSAGYCTFNGLIVALRSARDAIGVHNYPVIILDLDTHYGDGTAEILARLKLPNVRHVTHDPSKALGQRTQAALFNALHGLASMVERYDVPPLVLYQAGADAHVDDPLGAGYLTTKELKERDRVVFDLVRRRRLPCAWNLAGGYQDMEKVLEIHLNTWQAATR